MTTHPTGGAGSGPGGEGGTGPGRDSFLCALRDLADDAAEWLHRLTPDRLPYWARPHKQPTSVLLSPMRRWRMRNETTRPTPSGPGRRPSGNRRPL